jgi:hypothetical protein
MKTKGRTTERRERLRSERRTTGTAQLRLLGSERRERVPADWVLSKRTREIGLAGVAAIRETLRQAQPPEPVQKAS